MYVVLSDFFTLMPLPDQMYMKEQKCIPSFMDTGHLGKKNAAFLLYILGQ